MSYKKMIHVTHFVDIFTIIDSVRDDKIDIYIDADNIRKLIKIAPLLYDNVPALRTKIITNNKSYDFKTEIDIILGPMNDRLAYTDRKIKAYVVTNNMHAYKQKYDKLHFLNYDEFYFTINNSKNSSILIDINDKKTNQILNNKDLSVLVWHIA